MPTDLSQGGPVVEDRRSFLVLIAATAGAVLIPLNTSMLSVGLAPVVRAFGVSNAAGTWLILLYLAVMTSVQPTMGKLGDRYGHRLVFLSGLIAFTFASAGAALAPDFTLLILFRVLQGFFGAALAPNATALIRFAYPLERQGQAMGLYVSAFSVGLTVGPVLSGLLLTLWGWQALFWANLPLAILSIWIGFRVLPGGTGSASVAFDRWGTALFTALVMASVLSANLWKDGQLPFSLWVVVPALVAGSVLFYFIEQRADDPLLRFSLFRLPGFGAANLAIFWLHFMLYAVMVAVPLYIQQGRGMTAGRAGWMLSVLSIMQVLVAPFAGRLSDLVGRRSLSALGGALCTAGAFMLWRLATGPALLWTVAAMIITGVGVGLTSAPVQAASLVVLPRDLVGVGSGVWYTSRYLGNIMGALVVALLLPVDLSGGAGTLFAVVTAVGILLALTSLRLPSAPA